MDYLFFASEAVRYNRFPELKEQTIPLYLNTSEAKNESSHYQNFHPV